MATQLATAAELRDYLQIPDNIDDAQLNACLFAASRWIESDDGCGRKFDLDATDQTRYFTTWRQDVVPVIDLVSVTSVAVDSAGNRSYTSALDSDDYLLWPVAGPRYQEIRAWPAGMQGFPVGRLVRVVGKAGYVEEGKVPAAVKQACLILASRLFKRREAPFGILSSTDLGTFERISKEDPDAAALLAPYRRKLGWVVI